MTRILWFPLAVTLILAGPASADRYVLPDGSVVESDHPVPGGTLINGKWEVAAPPQLSEGDLYRLTGQVQLPRDRDVLEMLVNAVKYAPPASRWFESEKALYLQVLSRSRADVVVAPVQVEGAAFDQAERLLMTARLARYLEQPGRRVADPFLVERALGEGARRVEQRDVERLAAAIGATRIVLAFAGHDRAGHMNLRLRALEMKEGVVVNSPAPAEKSWTGLSFQDDPPSQVLARLLPEIGKALGLSAQQPAKPRLFPAAERLLIPKSPEAITRDSQDASPVLRAYHLQLLGALHPWYSEHARDRAFVRSLLVLDEVLPDSPDYRALKARALFYLQRRPFALQALGEPKTPEERALRAALDGNLPELEKAVAQIKAPLKRLLAELDLTELRARYSALDKKANRARLTALAGSPDWQALVLWKTRDWDSWFQRSNLELKAMLDMTLPAPGPTAETMVRAQGTLNEFDPRSAEFELSVYRHTNKLLTAKTDEWCCRNAFAMPNRWDYLDLIVDLAETNLLRQVEFDLDTQGNPERAADLLARYESVYKEHPTFTGVRAWTDWRLAQRRQEPEREGLRQQSLDSALHAALWAQGQTWGGWEGVHLSREDSRLGAPPRASDQRIWVAVFNAYIGDWPIRWYWPIWEQGGDPVFMARNAAERLAYSTHEFNAVVEATSFTDEAGKRKVLDETANRFLGAPDRVAYVAKQREQSGDSGTKKQVYQEAIRANPNAWEPYHALGKLAIEKGNYAMALKMFRSYPGFSAGSMQNRVALSQYANDAGSELYWRGAIEEAIPLYKLAAGYQTGSNGGMTSSLRLKLLDGDYQGAAEESLERAQRYDTVYAYRDFLALLYVMGHSKDAWPAFDSVMEKFENPQIWAAAHVGHRIDGKKDADVDRWLMSDHVKGASAGDYRFAPNFALLWYVVDRKPGPGFAELVEQLDTPAQNFVAEGPGWTVRGDRVAHPEGGGLLMVGPSNYQAEGRPKRTAGTIVRSNLAYFAEAYGLMRSGDYVGANRVFEEMAQHYAFEGTYAVAYFARAAAKSGNGDALEAHLDKAPPAEPHRFDYHLAKAFLVAAKGKHEDALKHLNTAFNARPNTEARPIFTEYQFAEACEWLFRDSKNPAYRKLALDWARKVQRIAPMHSWAYAMEAGLSTSPTARRRALAITLYLDPNSERASKFSAAERQKAREWLKTNNPFLIPRGKRDEA